MEGSCPWLAYGWSDKYCTYIYRYWRLVSLVCSIFWIIEFYWQTKCRNNPSQAATLHIHPFPWIFQKVPPSPSIHHPFPAPGAVVSQHAMPAGGGPIAICGGLDGPHRAQGGQHAACLAGFATWDVAIHAVNWSCHPCHPRCDPHMEHCEGTHVCIRIHKCIRVYIYIYTYACVFIYLFIYLDSNIPVKLPFEWMFWGRRTSIP